MFVFTIYYHLFEKIRERQEVELEIERDKKREEYLLSFLTNGIYGCPLFWYNDNRDTIRYVMILQPSFCFSARCTITQTY